MTCLPCLLANPKSGTIRLHGLVTYRNHTSGYVASGSLSQRRKVVGDGWEYLFIPNGGGRPMWVRDGYGASITPHVARNPRVHEILLYEPHHMSLGAGVKRSQRRYVQHRLGAGTVIGRHCSQRDHVRQLQYITRHHPEARVTTRETWAETCPEAAYNPSDPRVPSNDDKYTAFEYGLEVGEAKRKGESARARLVNNHYQVWLREQNYQLRDTLDTLYREAIREGLSQSNPYRTARYVHTDIGGGVDPRSIRTKTLPGGALLRIGCPKGHWYSRAQRCGVGTRAVGMLKPRSNPMRRLLGMIKRADLLHHTNLRRRAESAIGRLQERDLGKYVYEIDGIVQVENDAQRDRRRRTGSNPELLIIGNPRKGHNMKRRHCIRKSYCKRRPSRYAAFVRAQWKKHRAAFKKLPFKTVSKRLALAWHKKH